MKTHEHVSVPAGGRQEEHNQCAAGPPACVCLKCLGVFCVFFFFLKRITELLREIKRRGWAGLVYLPSAAKKAELASPFSGVRVWTLAHSLDSSPKSVRRSFLSNCCDSNRAICHRASLLQVKHMHRTWDSLEMSAVSILPLVWNSSSSCLSASSILPYTSLKWNLSRTGCLSSIQCHYRGTTPCLSRQHAAPVYIFWCFFFFSFILSLFFGLLFFSSLISIAG